MFFVPIRSLSQVFFAETFIFTDLINELDLASVCELEADEMV